jgi:ribonuclease-3 family protein
MDAPISLSAASLAYLGDAVFELLVRTRLTKEGEQAVSEYNRRAKGYVSAKAQANLYHRLFDRLTEDEQAVIKRGRNLHPFSRAKNASVSDYRHATGLEALFGYLYSQGRQERMMELFALCVQKEDE